LSKKEKVSVYAEEKVEEAPHFASDAIARSGDWSREMTNARLRLANIG